VWAAWVDVCDLDVHRIVLTLQTGGELTWKRRQRFSSGNGSP
jgi:hypothetical protein